LYQTNDSFNPLARSTRPVVWLAGLLVAACGGGGYGGGGSGNPAPTVTISVAPTAITLGQSATLNWSSSSGTSCTASGGWTGSRPASGTENATPTESGTVTFTLTCSGDAYTGSASGSATLTVNAASAFSKTSLVGDAEGGVATTTDPNLVNPWGVAFGPTSAVWVANNHSDTATLYDGNGRAAPNGNRLIVQFPAGEGGAAFGPTGIVFNAGPDFVVNLGVSGSAIFIFAGEGGMIAGWTPIVDVDQVITMYAASDGAVYKGLAIASDGGSSFLYATDFFNGKIDVFDGEFVRRTPTEGSVAFNDAELPEGYAPFGIQALRTGEGGATQIYVSYAKQDEAVPADEAAGAGLGIVNVFDTSGNLVRRLVDEGGALNAPWGMALAPANFGTLSNALLVGNFGDGTIQGFDPSTGRYLGAVTDGEGTPFEVAGLWAIAFGNDALNQPRATLFYAAGTNAEVNGELGRIDLGATPPLLGEPPVVTLAIPDGDVSGTVTLTAEVRHTLAISKVEFLLNNTTVIGTATSEPFSVEWDTSGVANGKAALRAVATDANGNVGSSLNEGVNIGNSAVSTLTQIQEAVFTPRCSACHDGSQPANGQLPGAMNLKAGASFASLVNVASLQQPDVMRVRPGEPANSYLIHKLEGTFGITGQRMPLGGPFLDQATIDQIRSWIESGAPNN